MTGEHELYTQVRKQTCERIRSIDNIVLFEGLLIRVMLQKIVVHYHYHFSALALRVSDLCNRPVHSRKVIVRHNPVSFVAGIERDESIFVVEIDAVRAGVLVNGNRLVVSELVIYGNKIFAAYGAVEGAVVVAVYNINLLSGLLFKLSELRGNGLMLGGKISAVRCNVAGYQNKPTLGIFCALIQKLVDDKAALVIKRVLARFEGGFNALIIRGGGRRFCGRDIVNIGGDGEANFAFVLLCVYAGRKSRTANKNERK